jgi:putative N6-adenine-specific DNA methylase
MDLFAVTAPGLESVCAAELRDLGIDGVPVDGGVTWRGDAVSVFRANLESRTASRVVCRAGSFRARTFPELERHAGRLDWARILPRGRFVNLRVTCRKSRLYHEGAVAERIAGVLPAGIVAGAAGVAAGGDPEGGADGQLVIVRFFRDVCTVSVDTSGALLHQRGYRRALAKAPLRETVAAALLLAAGWRGDTPLLDPMCGSGTIAIEAALLARRIPPGMASPGFVPRPFAFQAWPGFDAGAWTAVVEAARGRALPAAPAVIRGSDRDAGAIAAARSNAERAGVAGDLELERRPLSAVAAPAGVGHLLTNPPYGVRVGDRRALRALYTALGELAAARLGGWTVAFLSADPGLDAATGLALEELLATRNGGIPVRLVVATVPARRAQSHDSGVTGADFRGEAL